LFSIAFICLSFVYWYNDITYRSIYMYIYKQSYLSSIVEMIIINDHGSLYVCCWQYLFYLWQIYTIRTKRNNKTGCCQFKIRFIHPVFWDNEKERVDWYRLDTAFVLKEEISNVLWCCYSSQCRFSFISFRSINEQGEGGCPFLLQLFLSLSIWYVSIPKYEVPHGIYQ